MLKEVIGRNNNPQKLITAVVIRRNMGQSIVFMFWLDAESSKISAPRTKKKAIGVEKENKKREREIEALSITARMH